MVLEGQSRNLHMIDKCTTELCLQSILDVGVCACVSVFVSVIYVAVRSFNLYL